MFLLDQYDDAELGRKKVAALFAAFITSPAPDMLALPGQEATSEDGVVIAGLEPGIIQRLDAGEDIRFSEPSEVGGSYESFQFRGGMEQACRRYGVDPQKAGLGKGSTPSPPPFGVYSSEAKSQLEMDNNPKP